VTGTPEPYTTPDEPRRRKGRLFSAAVLVSVVVALALLVGGTSHGSSREAVPAAAPPAPPTVDLTTAPPPTLAAAVPVADAPIISPAQPALDAVAGAAGPVHNVEVALDGGKPLTVRVTTGAKDGIKGVTCVELDRHTGLPGASSCFQQLPSFAETTLLMVETGDPALAVFGLPDSAAGLDVGGRAATLATSSTGQQFAVVAIDIGSGEEVTVSQLSGLRTTITIPQLGIVAAQENARAEGRG
jgi:hypothetical protein